MCLPGPPPVCVRRLHDGGPITNESLTQKHNIHRKLMPFYLYVNLISKVLMILVADRMVCDESSSLVEKSRPNLACPILWAPSDLSFRPHF